MADTVEEIHDVRVLLCDPAGPPLVTRAEFNDVIALAWSQKVGLVAIPLARLEPGFLDLRSGIAGEVMQKFVTYHLRVAFIGNMSAPLARSRAWRDFVRETNRGNSVWFVDDLEALIRKLAALRPRA
jgi:hypothetical protein